MRKRGKKFWRALLLLTMTVLMSNSSVVFAQEGESNDLTAEIKTELSADQTAADVTVVVKNTGAEPAHDIQVRGVLPEGIELDEESSIQKTIGTLVPGSESALQYTVRLSDASEQKPSADSDDHNQSDVPEKEQNEANVSETKQSNISKQEENNKGNKTDDSTVDTGDHGNLTFYIILCVAAIGIIVAICMKRKKGKKILSILLCVSLLTPVLSDMRTVKAEESENKSFSVEGRVILDETEYTLEADVSYTCPEAIVPSGETLTRAQWITELLSAVGYDGQEADWENVELPFEDIEDHDLRNTILMAYGNSILPDLGTEFLPDTPATREFAAVTAVKALGFVPVLDVKCNDSDEVTYKKEIETAVAMDIFRMDNDMFYPLRALSRSEANAAIESVRSIVENDAPEGNAGEIYYDSDVLIIPEDASYDVNENIVTLSSGAEGIEEGMIFVTPDQTPYKVVSVENSGDTCVVKTETPELDETLTGITAEGTATMDFSKFVPAEGVTIQQATVHTMRSRASTVDAEGSLGGQGKAEFKIKKQIGAGELAADISFSLPRVLYKADMELGWGGVNVKNAYIKLPAEMEVEGSYTVSTETIPTDDSIELGKVPIVGIAGIGVNVQLELQFDIKGQLHAKYTLEGTTGAEVLCNRLRLINELQSKFDVPSLGAEVKWGGGISAALEACNTWELIDVGVAAGLAAKGELIIRNPELSCMDADLHLYGEISALEEGIIGEWLDIGYKWEFWNSDNSPLKYRWHLENLQRVDGCTYNGEEDSGGSDDGNTGTEEPGDMPDDTYEIKGTVYSETDKLPLSGVIIRGYEAESDEGIELGSSSEDGSYSVTLNPDIVKIEFALSGFSTKIIDNLLMFDGNVYLSLVPDIPEDAMEFNGHKYKFYTDSMTWQDAKVYCESQGGHLVTITSEEEQDAVYQYIAQFGIDADIWLGISDAEVEGDWSHWITGEPVTYTNWGQGEPDNNDGGQDYGVICTGYRSKDEFYIEPGQWDDISNNSSSFSGYFICEWD